MQAYFAYNLKYLYRKSPFPDRDETVTFTLRDRSLIDITWIRDIR